MKRRISLFLSLLLALVMLIQMVPAAAAAESGTDEVFEDYYGRAALAQLPNSTALLYAYDQIAEGVENSEAEISVYDGTNPISMEEISVVMDAYRRDYAHHFWLGNTYSTYYLASTVTRIVPSYIMSGSQLDAAKAAFEAEVDGLLACISPTMSEFEIELFFHDKLARRIVYAESTNAHNAYGALVEGVAVCEGYAEAFQYLLHRAGIQSFLALGTSQGGAHEWNIVRIDGNYYHADLTWDDQGSYLLHSYFNQTDTVISEDHALYATDYALPICSAEDANYFVVKGGLMADYSVDAVAQRLKDNALITSVYVPGGVGAFLTWFGENIIAIAVRAGVSGGFAYGYTYLGKEVVLEIVTCDHADLTFVPAADAACETDGNEAHYECVCGRLFWDSGASEVILDRGSVAIAASGHDYQSEYQCDASGHWHDCRNCTAHDEPAAHTPDIPAPTVDRAQLCSVCGYEIQPKLALGAAVSVNESGTGWLSLDVSIHLDSEDDVVGTLYLAVYDANDRMLGVKVVSGCVIGADGGFTDSFTLTFSGTAATVKVFALDSVYVPLVSGAETALD